MSYLLGIGGVRAFGVLNIFDKKLKLKSYNVQITRSLGNKSAQQLDGCLHTQFFVL